MVPRGCVRQSTCPGGNQGFDFYSTLAKQNPNVFHIFVLNEIGGTDVIGRAFLNSTNLR